MSSLRGNAWAWFDQIVATSPLRAANPWVREDDGGVRFEPDYDTLRLLFGRDRPVVALCAAGIIIRALAPLLGNKRAEPPVLAVAEDGSTVVPLLGGLRGVNTLARQMAAALGCPAAITTTWAWRRASLSLKAIPASSFNPFTLK